MEDFKMNKKVCIVYSRGLIEKAKKHVNYVKTAMGNETLIDLMPKLIRVYDDKGNFRDEADILSQKLNIVKDYDEMHIFWDGTDPDAAVIIGMALALEKDIVSYYVSPVGIRKFLWEVRASDNPER
jgi:hypothetical protein